MAGEEEGDVAAAAAGVLGLPARRSGSVLGLLKVGISAARVPGNRPWKEDGLLVRPLSLVELGCGEGMADEGCAALGCLELID